MADNRVPAGRWRARAGRISIGVAVAVGVAAALVGSAAGTSGRPGSERADGLDNPSASGQFPRTPAGVPDVAGEPIPFGTARYLGRVPKQAGVGSAVVAMATTPDGRGYWLVASDGAVFRYGDARYYGPWSRRQRHGDIVAMAAAPDGGGYWLVAHDGAVFKYGDARFYGPWSGRQRHGDIVAMAATPDGGGYWLVSSGGAVFRYGNARSYPAASPRHLRGRIVDIVATPDGGGYWLVSSGGAVFKYGDARSYGSPTHERLDGRIVAMAATPDGGGYWLVSSGGAVFKYGDARFYGAASSFIRRNPIVAVAATPDGHGYWLLPTSPPPPLGLPAPGPGFVAGHVTAIGDSVMLDAQPDLVADIAGIDVEAAVSRQWGEGMALAQQLKSEDRLGAIVVIDLGTNGPVTPTMFTQMMNVLAGASRVVFVTVHLPPSYSWWQSVNETLEQGVPKYPRDRLADFNKLADENPQWFGPDGVHMPIGGTGAQAMAKLIKSQI